MAKNTSFYYFIQDLDLLRKVRTIVTNFISNSTHIIFDDLNKFDLGIDDGVIIVDSEMDFFQEHFIATNKEIVLVVINDILNDFHDYPNEVYISRSRVLTSLSAILYDLKNTSEFNTKYYSVEINNITLNMEAPCDLFLRINDEKFLKCVKTGDIFDAEIRDRYIKKNEFLWVEKADFYLFGNFLYGQDDLENEINTPFTVEKADHIELIHDMAKSCGISEQTIQVMQNSIESIKADSDKRIKSLLDKFDEMKGSFLYSHSYFTCLLCIEIAKRQDWFQPQHIDKLTLAAMVHDLGYKDANNALNEALPKSKVLKLEHAVREDVLGHVDAVLEILENSKAIDSDVINIIKRHHGGRGEDSYPLKSYATELDLLSGVFILCHSFSICFIKMAFNKNKIDKVMAYIEMIYNKGNLKKIFPGFKSTILELIR